LGDPYLACAVGDEATLRTQIADDPTWVNRPGGSLGMAPLVAVTHSGLVRLPAFSGKLLASARLLLEAAADPNQSWINSAYPDSPLSALYGAAGKNHNPEMTKLLLDFRANLDDNESLYHSLESGDLICTRLLLDAGAKVDGTNAVAKVLDSDNLAGLQLLLDYGGNPNDGRVTRGNSALHHGIRRRRSVVHIDLLIKAGADVTARNADGLTPYRLAVLEGLPEVAALLPPDPEALSVQERFVSACASCDHAAIKALLAETPDVVQSLSENQLKQLPAMAASGTLPAVEAMVKAGWPIAVRGGDWNASALNLAVFRGDVAMCGFLLDYRASWTERHGFGDNVMGTLSWASRNLPAVAGDWLACAKLLAAHGMPVPGDNYEFSDEIEQWIEESRRPEEVRIENS
jgi:ankyrin repeat protein